MSVQFVPVDCPYCGAAVHASLDGRYRCNYCGNWLYVKGGDTYRFSGDSRIADKPIDVQPTLNPQINRGNPKAANFIIEIAVLAVMLYLLSFFLPTLLKGAFP